MGTVKVTTQAKYPTDLQSAVTVLESHVLCTSFIFIMCKHFPSTVQYSTYVDQTSFSLIHEQLIDHRGLDNQGFTVYTNCTLCTIEMLSIVGEQERTHRSVMLGCYVHMCLECAC